ncbi:winged helix-turn-helix domain-containing protein, partial [Rhizobium johnstonii]|uniref:winged helix-turn-helix domain-containing protein n=1 Tax=Rhizobium johnstonii TaxID=3019933 RepID=UPI003F9B20D7
ARHRVWIDGAAITLSYSELALLAYLVLHPGVLHTRSGLIEALFSTSAGEQIGHRTVDVYLQRLRRRLDPYGDIIRTVRGRGYRLDPHPDLRVVG